MQATSARQPPDCSWHATASTLSPTQSTDPVMPNCRHPTAAPTNTIAAIAPAIAMSSKLIVSPNPAALYASLTDRCFSFTNQRAPAANAHKTSPTVPHTQTQKDEYLFVQPHTH